MAKFHIAALNHGDHAIANSIHSVMMEAYRVEARLLNVSEFPPLRRTSNDISRTRSCFIGAFVDDCIVAVIETEEGHGATINIAALVVQPAHFRRGLGRALVQKTIEMHPQARITVSTGAKNAPAIALYKQLGFETSTAWSADQDIEMVALNRQN